MISLTLTGYFYFATNPESRPRSNYEYFVRLFTVNMAMPLVTGRCGENESKQRFAKGGRIASQNLGEY